MTTTQLDKDATILRLEAELEMAREQLQDFQTKGEYDVGFYMGCKTSENKIKELRAKLNAREDGE